MGPAKTQGLIVGGVFRPWGDEVGAQDQGWPLWGSTAQSPGWHHCQGEDGSSKVSALCFSKKLLLLEGFSLPSLTD